MLPCEACGAHCRSFSLGYPGGIQGASRCRETLAAFVLALHNEVAARTRPNAKPWTATRAASFYATGVLRAPDTRTWAGDARLVRELSDEAISSKQRSRLA